MKVTVLGAHNTESKNTHHTCLLVDDQLALDAGALTSVLSIQEQLKLNAVLLTHGHYDHIRDLPALAMNLFLREKSIDIYTHQAAWDYLTQYLLNGKIYPEFHKRPEDHPTLRIHLLSPYQEVSLEGYKIFAAPVTHAIPALGYQVSSPEGKRIFYTGDTGAGLSEIWTKISPQVLFIELTALNRWEESMAKNGHLTSRLLKQELLKFHEIKGYFPRVITLHINTADESEIKSEVAEASNSLGVSIEMGYEGMQIEV